MNDPAVKYFLIVVALVFLVAGIRAITTQQTSLKRPYRSYEAKPLLKSDEDKGVTTHHTGFSAILIGIVEVVIGVVLLIDIFFRHH
jgi:uncharacterized membrane protein YphA (DoxX/SURF4 family)